MIEKIIQSTNEVKKVDVEKEARRNILSRYSEKIRYYLSMDYSFEDAIHKARRFYKIRE